MNKRAIQKQETRSKLIQSARHLYAEHGFLAVTMEQIAQHAGVAKGTIFTHFQSQDELICTIVQQLREQFGNQLYQQMRAVKDDIRFMLTWHIELLQEHEALYRHLIIERTLLSESAQLIYLEMQSIVSNYIFLVAQQAMEQHRIKKMGPYLFFNTWIGLLHYYIANQDLFQPAGSVLTTHADELVAHFYSLIKI
ncbi:TetR/AcrR family transcriptional regulator [Listeria booriae]|uniref:TetR/AcrR family transcriptional regulator n=1 Tax=Listeria booriae TaxID=1552123 RepID=UPI001627AC99|nr:TetR/AcrR family transcriptional regulator [Listeria booriae]MBC2316033.1 TetR/AcrR family transcriptional regulator [Listeria booriae]